MAACFSYVAGVESDVKIEGKFITGDAANCCDFLDVLRSLSATVPNDLSIPQESPFLDDADLDSMQSRVEAYAETLKTPTEVKDLFFFADPLRSGDCISGSNEVSI